MTPVESMTGSEVTRELVDLCAEAATDERRVLWWLFTAQPIPHVSRDGLTDAVASLPEDEQRKLLPVARRLVVIGQRTYGPLDLARDRRDYRNETVEELIDAGIYLACDLLANGKPSPLLRDTVDIMRRSLSERR